MKNIFFTEEHLSIRDMVREFSQTEIAPFASEFDRTQKFPTKIINKMGDLGLMGMIIPNKYGGAGLDMMSFVLAIIELAKVDASVAITMAAHTSLGSLPLLLYGSEQQKQKYLPRLAKGEILGAFGLTEPNAGSDAGGTQTKAILEKNNYRVNGGKIFITNAGKASVLSFTSRIEENGQDKGIGAFIIPTDIEGLEIGNKEKKMGWRSSDTRQIFFKNMCIPKHSLIGRPGDGFKKFLKTLVSGRISIGALSIGTAIGAYNKALKYSNERESFGKKINQFQSIAFKLADMATKIEASKLLVYNAAWLKDQGLDFIKQAAMAKLFASESAMEITGESIQILGGNGYVREGDVERFFRDAKILEIGEGTSEIQRLIISREILKQFKF
tara:strand:- start:434 stop:1588 length:1155 start_codon:yes stop_codon:yes gene_type:complete